MSQSEERGLTALLRNAISRELFTSLLIKRRLSLGAWNVTTIKAYLRL
jgi:hypothetical protein